MPKNRSLVQTLHGLMPVRRSKVQLADERTQLMLDATPLCVSIISKDYKNIDCNQEAVKLFEVRDKQEYIERFWEFQPEYQPDGTLSMDKVRSLIDKAYKEGYCHFEWMHQMQNGELMPCEVTLVRVEYKSDHLVFAYMRDLREYEKMMSEIKRRDDLLQTVNLAATAMLATTDEATFDDTVLSGMELIGRGVDADRVQIWQNEAIDGELCFVHKNEWLSDTGKRMSPVPIGLNFPYSRMPEWYEKFRRGEYMNAPLSRLPQSDQNFLRAYEIRSIVNIPLFLHEQFWGFFSIDDCRKERTFSDDEISILRSAGILITNALLRNQNTLEARATAARLKAVVSNYPGVICSANKDRKISLFDGLLLPTLLDRDMFFEGQSLDAALEKEEYRHIMERIVNTFDGGAQDWSFEVNDKVIHMTTTPIPADDGSVTGVVGRIDDVTEMTRLAERLETALDEAKAATQAKSAFIANMSHEIRTPMNSIIGFSELAMDDIIPKKTRDYLEKIRENSEWLLQIINDILDIAKIEAGKLELERIPFDLHEIFAYCQTAIMPKALEKGLSLHFYAEPSIGKRLLGDPTRLRQVLLNLLSNAVKFTNVGTVKVSSSIEDSDESNVTMSFEVRDSGIGMTPDQIEKIYEPFMQADASTTRLYGGTGLGIPITKNIIELMGGSLAVESAPGIGSKFSFEMTFDTIDVPTEPSKDRVFANEFEKPIFQGEILICEDSAMNQQVICEHLTRVGLQPFVAENGKEGVDIVQERIENGDKPFDLIFMDINMPVMDGLEAATIIAKLETGAPIVAMTANIMPSDKELYKMSGLPDCLSKPFTSQELWQCLMKYLNPVSWGMANNKQQTDYDMRLDRKLKTGFAKENQGKFREIVKAIEEKDIELAHRLAHTLKSNAGQIGKTKLQSAAADVERLLKENNGDVLAGDALDLLEAELSTVLEELAPLIRQTKTSTRPFNKEQALSLLEKLEPMLNNRNPECHNYLDDLNEIPGAETLVEQVDNFDFRQAIATLAELKEKWR